MHAYAHTHVLLEYIHTWLELLRRIRAGLQLWGGEEGTTVGTLENSTCSEHTYLHGTHKQVLTMYLCTS